MDKSLVVLAAGIGSRYGGLKQMDPVGPGGEFIVDYAVFDALRAGFNKVVFLIRPGIEKDFRATLGERVGKHVETVYVMQELTDLPPGYTVPAERTKPWGTGHAVYACRNAVKEPFGVINADDFYGRESYELLGQFLDDTAPDPRAYAAIAFTLRNTLSEHGSVARGICRVSDDGRLVDVVERTKIEKAESGARFLDDNEEWQPLTGDEPVSMNMWGFKPSIFGHLGERFVTFFDQRGTEPRAEFFVPTVVDELIKEGKAVTHAPRTPCSWFGVTYPQDKAVVEQAIRGLVDAGEYPSALWG